MLNGGSAPNPRDLPLRADPGHNVKTAEGLSPRRGLGPEVSAQVASQRCPIFCSGRNQFSGTALALAGLAVPSNLVVVGREL